MSSLIKNNIIMIFKISFSHFMFKKNELLKEVPHWVCLVMGLCTCWAFQLWA